MMPIDIERVEYFTAAGIQREVGVVRQTLGRGAAEVEAIREYSNPLEPADSPRPRRRSGASATTPKGDA
jgi:hypothetical protein